MARLQYRLILFNVLIILPNLPNPTRVMRLTPRLATALIRRMSVPLLDSRVMVPTPTQALPIRISELCGTETSEWALEPGPASMRTALAWNLATAPVLLLACRLDLRTS